MKQLEINVLHLIYNEKEHIKKQIINNDAGNHLNEDLVDLISHRVFNFESVLSKQITNILNTESIDKIYTDFEDRKSYLIKVIENNVQGLNNTNLNQMEMKRVNNLDFSDIKVNKKDRFEKEDENRSKTSTDFNEVDANNSFEYNKNKNINTKRNQLRTKNKLTKFEKVYEKNILNKVRL